MARIGADEQKWQGPYFERVAEFFIFRIRIGSDGFGAEA